MFSKLHVQIRVMGLKEYVIILSRYPACSVQGNFESIPLSSSSEVSICNITVVVTLNLADFCQIATPKQRKARPQVRQDDGILR